MTSSLNIVVLGLTLSSSWGNGHATTYRGLLRALAERGHRVLFLERNRPWYAEHRDLADPAYCELQLYDSLEELRARWRGEVAGADVVIVGSYVPEGVEVGEWVLETADGVAAFYDIDTPVTLAKLAAGDFEYLSPELVARYDVYLSFTGGPVLRRIEREYRSPRARALYCSVDPALYFPEPAEAEYDLGYLGTYSVDRQPALERLLLEPARRWAAGQFVVAGPLYPEQMAWPDNVVRTAHLPPGEHRAFYNAQRFTLNITRADMVRAGWSPSVRLFEAAACGVPILSDLWPGLESLFRPGSDILIVRTAEEALEVVRGPDDQRRREIGARARARVLAAHTAAHRAEELERHLQPVLARKLHGTRQQVPAARTARPVSNPNSDRCGHVEVSRADH